METAHDSSATDLAKHIEDRELSDEEKLRFRAYLKACGVDFKAMHDAVHQMVDKLYTFDAKLSFLESDMHTKQEYLDSCKKLNALITGS